MLPAGVRALGGWLLAGSLAALGQQPALRVYSIRDGLKYSQVFCVLQDRHGLLWVGTSYGVSRYDGREFWNLTKAQGLPHDTVRGLAEDGAGTIWVLTQEGLARIAPLAGALGIPVLVPLPGAVARLPGRSLRRIEAAGDAVWILSESGLHRFRADRLEGMALPDGVSPGEVTSLGPVTAGDAWLTTSDRVVHVEAGRAARSFPAAGDLGAALALARAGPDIVLLQKGGMARLEGERFAPEPASRLPAGMNPSRVVATRSGLLVLTPARGAALLAPDGSVRLLSTAEGLPSPNVHDALEDRNGILWLATEDGLVKIFDLAVTSYPARPPEVGAVTLAVARDAAGTLWIGHSDGLTELRDGHPLLHDPFPQSPEESGVWAVLPLPSGGVLAATRHGLVRMGRGSPERFPGLPLAGRGRVFGLHRAPDGSIWASTLEGVIRFRWDETSDRPVEARSLTEVEGRPLGEARGLDSETDGTLWIGTDGSGVVRHDAAGSHRFDGGSGLPTGVCRSVLALDREVLVGTDVGLYTLRDGRARPVAAVNELFGRPYVVAMARGRPGSAWIALTDRVLRLDSGRVEEVLDRASGLLGTSTTAENCLHYEPGDRLWVGMVGGVTSFDLGRRRRDWPAPDVLLLGAADGEGNPVLPGARVRHRANTLTFAFRSPTFLAEETTAFQERLVGYDRSWSAPHAETVQRYTNLPAGDYTLEVRAVSQRGPSRRPAALRFSVGAPWWQTAVARGGLILLLAALGYAAVQVRTRQLRRSADELRARVAERTRELSDANRRLEEAQERIARLLETGGKAQEDIVAWAREAALDIARTVGAAEISVHELEGERTTSLAGGAPGSLSGEDRMRLSGGAVCASPGEMLVPVRGAAGELLGYLAVRGETFPFGEAERRLLLGFAHQLGGALEMRRIRRKLAQAEGARAAVRKEMEARGVVIASVCPSCLRCYPAGSSLCDADGIALQERGLLPYRVRNRYRLLRQLGEGGMGIVYLAEDEQLSREVAIKIIRPDRFDDPSMRLRFEREARALAQIQHPGVVALFDSGDLEDGSAFLIMERLQGKDLATVLHRRGRGTPGDVASLLVQAAGALAAAHRAGVVHRDVKPENLFLTRVPEGFTIKVVDFGLARQLAAGEGLTQSGMVVGTPWYMAPEQVRGEAVTPKSDVYALAVVGWEALTGMRLVKAEAVGEIFAEILYKAPPPPSSRREGLPAPVDAAFAAALEKDAEKRPQGVERWAQELAALLRPLAPSEPGWTDGRPA